MFVKARQRVIVDVAQRKAFNQLDSSDTGESLAGEDIRYCSVDPVTSSIFLLWERVLSNGSNSASKSALGLLISPQPLNFSERDLTVLQLLVDQVSIASPIQPA